MNMLVTSSFLMPLSSLRRAARRGFYINWEGHGLVYITTIAPAHCSAGFKGGS